MIDLQNYLPRSITDQISAVKDLGVAVEQFKKGGLQRALGSLLNTPDNYQNRNQSKKTGEWNSTDYGASIANGSFRPKHKFLFKIEFLFYPEVLQKYEATTKDWLRNFTFNVKTAERPKVELEFEEINQYNFKTKVLKNIKHRELSMTFTDDVGNSVQEFFRFMLMAHSPITRRSATSQFDIGSIFAEGQPNGMLFDNDAFSTQDSAHRGAVDTTFGNVIKVIKLTQFFVDPTADIKEAPKEIAFFFINPRVTSFDLDDVSHESDDPATLLLTFDYDSIIMTGAKTISSNEDASKKLTSWGTAPGDITVLGANGPNTSSPGGSGNPYAGVKSGVKQNKSALDILKNAAISAGLGLNLNGPLTEINNIKNRASKAISGLSNLVDQSFAKPIKSLLSDSSTAGPDTATQTKSTD